MTEQRKAPIESLRSQAESLGLSMHKSDSEGLYYLAKGEPVTGESRRIGPDMSPDDIAAFLMEETAVRAALRPTCWLAEVAANIERPYKSDTVSVIVRWLQRTRMLESWPTSKRAASSKRNTEPRGNSR